MHRWKKKMPIEQHLRCLFLDYIITGDFFSILLKFSIVNIYFLCSKMKKNTQFGIKETYVWTHMLPLSGCVNLGKRGNSSDSLPSLPKNNSYLPSRVVLILREMIHVQKSYQSHSWHISKCSYNYFPTL